MSGSRDYRIIVVLTHINTHCVLLQIKSSVILLSHFERYKDHIINSLKLIANEWSRLLVYS